MSDNTKFSLHFKIYMKYMSLFRIKTQQILVLSRRLSEVEAKYGFQFFRFDSWRSENVTQRVVYIDHCCVPH